MSDLISRADAINAVHKYFVDKINNEPHEIDEDGDDVFTDMKSVNALFHHNKMVSKALKALPSADAEQGFRGGKIPPKEMLDGTVLIPKHQWLEMERELAELKEKFESADAAQGEWVRHTLWGNPWFTCSECNYHGRNDFNFCPNCGARMTPYKGGDDK